jgi:phage tail-like protein
MQGRLWLVMGNGGDGVSLWRTDKDSFVFVAAGYEELRAAFRRSALVRSDNTGFCLERGNDDGGSGVYCYTWYGRPVTADCISGAATDLYEKQGQLLTVAIDSGIPRCRWHRLRLEADVPDGAGIEVAMATSAESAPLPQGLNSPPWNVFNAGVPHPEDWQILPKGATDGLVQQPAGRYLFLRLRLTGDGRVTPVIRRLHLDFPRSTSADYLPYVFREDAASSDFTERFLSLFDADLEDIDTVTRRFSALLNAEHVPEDVLKWIAGFMGLVLDPQWDVACKRRVLKAAPDLFRRRGTRAGLGEAVHVVFGETPAIREFGAERSWGAVASKGEAPSPIAARLNQTRLFSRRKVRMTVGSSSVGTSRIMSYGNPDDDPHLTGAFRFSIGVPKGGDFRVDVLERLIDSQKPAHTLASVSMGGDHGFAIVTGLRLGIDTLLGSPPLAVVGDAGTILNRQSVLASRRPPAGGSVLGKTAVAGNSTCRE